MMRVIVLTLAFVALSCAQSYDWSIGFNKFDTDGNQVLTMAEFTGAFKKYDMAKGDTKTGDGVIDLGEFVAQYPLDTGVSIDAATYMFFGLDVTAPENVLTNEELVYIFGQLAGDDSEVSFAEYSALMNKVGAELVEAATARVSTDAKFTAADTDGDNNLSSVELLTLIGASDSMGPDGSQGADGFIDPEEFKAFWGNDGTPDSDDNAQRLFDRLDTDADGYFGSQQEKEEAFGSLDPNGDGLISKTEFDLTLVKLFAQFNNERDYEAANAFGY